MENREVNTFELIDKNFKHIVKIVKGHSDSDLQDIVSFLHKYDPSIEFVQYRNDQDELVELEIKGESVSCKSTDFGVGIIVITEDNECYCAVSDLNIGKE